MRFEESKLKRRGLILALWIFIGLCFAFQSYMNFDYYNKEYPFSRMLSWELTGWLLWAAIAPAIYYLARRFPPQLTKLHTAVLVHLGAAIVIAVTHFALHYKIVTTFDSAFLEPVKGFHIEPAPLERIAWRFMVYFIVLIVCYAMESQKRVRREEQNASDLRVELANAQLQALKMQLHPHFLFNTLNSISELMHQDTKAADEMIIRLSDFLRMTLDPAVTQEVTLEKEIEFLKHYLEIEQVRFKENLSVVMNIDPETRRARVPYLILQPVVENAIRHGIAPNGLDGKLKIEAIRKNGVLHLEVSDNGVGLPEGTRNDSYFTKGLGLSNTRARLEKLYGENFKFDLQTRESKGLTVILELPFTESEEKA